MHCIRSIHPKHRYLIKSRVHGFREVDPALPTMPISLFQPLDLNLWYSILSPYGIFRSLFVILISAVPFESSLDAIWNTSDG